MLLSQVDSHYWDVNCFTQPNAPLGLPCSTSQPVACCHPSRNVGPPASFGPSPRRTPPASPSLAAPGCPASCTPPAPYQWQQKCHHTADMQIVWNTQFVL
jgi:hypothetical protein